jgi:hypothetical protein
MRYTLIILLLSSFSAAFAQRTDAALGGQLQGILRDSADGRFLQSATVAIYTAKDSSLVSYRLSNTSGLFHFDALPTGIPLQLVISMIGYRNHYQVLSIQNIKVDLKEVRLAKSSISLSEFTVYQPPVQMNGDTLEFNMNALVMDKNAVVEDALRKLNGVTVWGDGKITVFGKTIKNLLVEGKPFFGGDPRVATRNLPKSAVEKIQVYTQNEDQLHPLDSVLNMNIRLKKGMKAGLFGKAGAGGGTDKRFSAEGVLGIFSPRNQFSIAAAANNINISPTDISSLIRNNSFKGVGANIEYQPDFSIEGEHRSNTGGLNFQHDFIPDPAYNRNNRLEAGYFADDHHSRLQRHTLTKITLNDDNTLLQTGNSNSRTAFTKQQFNSNYNLRNSQTDFYLTPSLSINSYKYDEDKQNTSETDTEIQSTNNTHYEQDKQTKQAGLKAGYRSSAAHLKADYTFSWNETADDQLNQTNFYSLYEPWQNRVLDRSYRNLSHSMYHEASIRYGFKDWLFGKRELLKINMEVTNTVKFYNEYTNNHVTDLDSLTGEHVANSYLTNVSRYNTIDETPGLAFSRMFTRGFINRNRKTIILNTTMQEQFFRQESSSGKEFQRFSNSYKRFLPGAGITYSNEQFGDHMTTVILNYYTSAAYPTVYQIAPLTDDANIYYRQQVNKQLQPSYKHEMDFSLSWISFQSTKLLDSYTFGVKAGHELNTITDSTLYDNLGRAFNYSVNGDVSKFLYLSGDMYKAFKFKENQLQVNGKAMVNMNQTPRYINSVLLQTNTLYSDNSLSLLYTLKDILAFKLTQGLVLFKSKQADNILKNTIHKTMLSGSGNLPGKFTLSSNVTFNTSRSSYADPVHFTIWNASIIKRFLRGNQAEIKFSALDLLRQNTSIVNYGKDNMLTTGNVNVLQQYFMMSFSWYPRKFGKKKN